MDVRRISAPTGGRDPVLVLVRLSVLIGAVWRRRCPLVGIMSPTFYPRPDDASSTVGGRVEVCLRQILRDSVGASLRWNYLDPFLVRLCLHVYRFDPSDVRLSSSAMVSALERWSYGVLARRHPDCLLQQMAEIRGAKLGPGSPNIQDLLIICL